MVVIDSTSSSSSTSRYRGSNNKKLSSATEIYLHRNVKKRGIIRVVIIIIVFTCFVLLFYLYMNILLSSVAVDSSSNNMSTKTSNNNNNNQQQLKIEPPPSSIQQLRPSIIAQYIQKNEQHLLSTTSSLFKDSNYYRNIIYELIQHSVQDILYELETYDPFGVRRIYDEILNNNNQSISLSTIQQIFPCPSSSSSSVSSSSSTINYYHQQHRITIPDQRNMTKLVEYQKQLSTLIEESNTDNSNTKSVLNNNNDNNNINYYIYFQHLRKAGGTHFCTLAQRNIPKLYIPKYYCMPDYYWPIPQQYYYTKKQRNKNNYQACAGCLHRYSNNEIEQYIGSYKIMGNEWDNFNVAQHFLLHGAIYTTSFRQPLDRAVSQYRFECVEDRGCTAKSIEQYWDRRHDLYNIYTSTFSDINPIPIIVQSKQKQVSQQQQQINKAVLTAYDTILQFHLVLVMELLPYSEQMVQSILGFHDTTILTKKVRPHNTGKLYRTNSWIPKDYLSTEQYKLMSESLVYDEILYDVARRIFLERLVCGTY